LADVGRFYYAMAVDAQTDAIENARCAAEAETDAIENARRAAEAWALGDRVHHVLVQGTPAEKISACEAAPPLWMWHCLVSEERD
jgi:hypothetical protein